MALPEKYKTFSCVVCGRINEIVSRTYIRCEFCGTIHIWDKINGLMRLLTDPELPRDGEILPSEGPSQPEHAQTEEQGSNKKLLRLRVELDGMDVGGLVSDGYHTFDELYDHRITLWIALCRSYRTHGSRTMPPDVWRSTLHSDGSAFDGWFVLGFGKQSGNQITYHIPISRWEETGFAETLDRAPKWDGHKPSDVIERLKRL